MFDTLCGLMCKWRERDHAQEPVYMQYIIASLMQALVNTYKIDSVFGIGSAVSGSLRRELWQEKHIEKNGFFVYFFLFV